MLTKHQKAYLVLKRLIDIVGSFLGILVLSPILLLCWLITLCTEGFPILLRQKRMGKNEKTFSLLKFRSMRNDAKQLGAEHISEADREHMVTKWGAFMRKTSLDELPQLFNILVGQMSFIGPRPNLLEEIEPELVQLRRSYVPNAYVVKPGLSGFSQVYLHREPRIEEKAKWDSYYVQNLSFWLDFKIFCWSFLILFGYQKGK